MADRATPGLGPVSLALIQMVGDSAVLRMLGNLAVAERSGRSQSADESPATLADAVDRGLLTRTADGVKFRDACLKDLAETSAVAGFLQPEFVDQRFVYDRAIAHLSQIGLGAVPLLVEMLGHQESSVARGASFALGKIGKPAVPALLWAMQWGNARVRVSAIKAFAVMKGAEPLDDDLVVMLARTLAEDDDEVVRMAAVEALSDVDDPLAIEALRRALNAPAGDMTRIFAQQALQRLGTPAARRAIDDAHREPATVGAQPSPTRVPRVFLSYAREDAATMAEYRRRLEVSGFDVWTDSQKLVAGEDWDVRLRFAISSSDFVVALLSAASWDGYQRVEVEEALARQRQSKANFLLPLFLSREEWAIGSAHWPPGLTDAHAIIADDYAQGWSRLYKDLGTATRQLGLTLPPRLRSEPRTDLTQRDLFQFVIERNLYSQDHNPNGKPLGDEWELVADDSLAVDLATGLTWTRTPVVPSADYISARRIPETFTNRSAAYASASFRLPTVEEAMSLMRPQLNDDRVHLPPHLSGDSYMLTCDTAPAPAENYFRGSSMVWVADFSTTGLHPMPLDSVWPVWLVTSTPTGSTNNS